LDWSNDKGDTGYCDGLEMAPQMNKWAPLYGTQVTAMVTTSELS